MDAYIEDISSTLALLARYTNGRKELLERARFACPDASMKELRRAALYAVTDAPQNEERITLILYDLALTMPRTDGQSKIVNQLGPPPRWEHDGGSL